MVFDGCMSQIQPLSQTIDSLFKEFKEIRVPLNQRGFEWGRDQASDFWNDLMEVAEDGEKSDDKKVFLGTAVLQVQGDTSICSVVDGQQRLTTISLLMIAIRETEKKLALHSAATILNDTYLGSLDVMGGGGRPKVSTSPLIRDVYNRMIDADWDGVFPKKIGQKSVKLQVRKISPVYSFFVERIQEHGFDRDRDAIQRLLVALLYRCYFVVIKIASEIEALEIFERMNARGVDLNAAELLKNHLFSQVSQDVISSEELANDWDENIVKNSENNLVQLLRYFYISRKGYIRKNALYTGLKSLVKELGGPKDFLAALKDFSLRSYNFTAATRKELEEYLKADIYKREIDGRGFKIKEWAVDDICDSLEALRLFRVSQHLPLINAAYERLVKHEGSTEADIDQLARLLRALEDFHFINNAICRKPTNEIEKFYAEKSKEIAESTKSLKELVNSVVQELGQRKEKIGPFVDNFTSLSYESGEASFRLLYYIFHRLNNQSKKGAQRTKIYCTDFRFSKKNYSIDHMSPRSSQLYDLLNENDRECINNIGNLMIIPVHTNSKAGNMPMSDEKIALYKGLSGDGLPVLGDFIKTFNTEDWATKDAILTSIDKRAQQMAQEAYNRIWLVGSRVESR